jgi:hypothetical protein
MVQYASLKVKRLASDGGEADHRVLSVSGGGTPGVTSEISFEVPAPGVVTLTVYNVHGQLVRRLLEEPMEPNTYRVDWNGLDERGARVAGGVYFLRLQTADEVATGKAVIVR